MSIIFNILEIVDFKEELKLDNVEQSLYAYEIDNYYNFKENLNNSYIHKSVYLRNDEQDWNSLVLIIKMNKIEEIIDEINEYFKSIGVELELTFDKFKIANNNERLTNTITEANLDMDLIKINCGLIIQIIQKLSQ